MHLPEHEWLDRKIYPFASHYLQVPAGQMHYIDEGQGKPILMVHGNPTWSFLYRHLVQALQSNYRCIAPDHLGFGLSDKPEDWTYDSADHAQNLKRLIESLGLNNITLVVHDWGGPIGLAQAVEDSSRVDRLVILNSWMWPVNQDPYYVTLSAVAGGWPGRLLIKRFNFFARVMMPMLFGNSQKLPSHIHKHYLKPLDTAAKRNGCWRFTQQITGAAQWLQQLWEKRKRLTSKPTLIVWGMKDFAFRRQELKRWTEVFPEAEVKRLDGSGHFVQEEAPDALYAAVNTFMQAAHPL